MSGDSTSCGGCNRGRTDNELPARAAGTSRRDGRRGPVGLPLGLACDRRGRREGAFGLGVHVLLGRTVDERLEDPLGDVLGGVGRGYPGVVESELAETISDEAARTQMKAYRADAISPEAIGEAVRYVVAQPTDVDVNEIVVRPTKAHAELYSAGLESRLRPLGLLLLRSTHHPPGKQTSLAIGGRRWRSQGEERHVVGGMVADHCVNELVAQRGDV
jgi:hypothetical protein